MTNSEALISVLQVSMPANSIEKALLDAGISASDDYSSSSLKAIDTVAVELLHGILSQPNVSEGGYSVSYDRNAVKDRILLLAKKHGLTQYTAMYTPTVKARNVW